MKIVPAILAGGVLATIAAVISLIMGQGLWTTLAAYAVFGMVGLLLFVLIDWIRLYASAMSPDRSRNIDASDLGHRAAYDTPEQ